MSVNLEDITTLVNHELVPELHLYEGRNKIVDMWHELDVEEPPYWLYAWPGGQSLARWTLDNANAFHGKSVLDFGCGTGINGIAAAMAGAQVVAVDKYELSRNLTDMNAAVNVVDSRLTTTADMPPLTEFDIILFGDSLYDVELSTYVYTLADAALNAGVRVLIGDPGREYLPRRRIRRLGKYTVNDVFHLERRVAMPTYAFEYLTNG